MVLMLMAMMAARIRMAATNVLMMPLVVMRILAACSCFGTPHIFSRRRGCETHTH